MPWYHAIYDRLSERQRLVIGIAGVVLVLAISAVNVILVVVGVLRFFGFL